MRIFIAIFLFSLNCFSQIQVQVTDPYFDEKKLAKPGAVEVHAPTAVKNTELPKTAEREEFFSQFAEVQKYYQSLDDLDRDLLWYNLQKKSLVDLQKIYPRISQENLKLMQQKRKLGERK